MNDIVATRLATARRIHIVGGSGSGKSTLALRVARDRKLPLYHLDRVAYEANGAGPRRPLLDRLADVRRIAAAPAWVTEGRSLWWTDELVRAADLIVWLDLPWQVEAWRVARRYVQQSIAGVNEHPGLFMLVRFILHNRRYHTRAAPVGTPDPDGPTSRAATALILAPHMDKVVHCRTPAAVKSVFPREEG